MPAAKPNQTLTFLRRRFNEVGIRPKTKHGQNFLIDLNLQRLLLDTAELDRRDVVLEVGTGTGSLTVLLAERAAAVVTVEIDPQLRQLASEELIGRENVTLMSIDALRNKNTLAPKLLETVRARLADVPEARFKLVANLPFNIATPVLSNLLATDVVPYSMTVTIQKELADRITAVPSTKDYGALSIWIQSQCQVELIRTLPPTVFWPRPKVTSAIIRIIARPELRARIPNLDFFHQFVRSMFFHRRKYLRGVLQSAFKNQLTKPDADRIMANLALSGDARAEQLSVQRMLDLCEAVRGQVVNNER
jgi:16S rRNA (adenine1518-N6/adenine1519-N6)-dimethyltransferase